MTSLVLELRLAASDSNINIVDLVRKAYVVAKLLKINEFEIWLSKELSGYKQKHDIVPEYRQIKGDLQEQSNNGVWVDPTYNNSLLNLVKSKLDIVRTAHISNSITEIDALFNKKSNFSLSIVKKGTNVHPYVVGKKETYRIVVSRDKIKELTHAIRNLILDWALELEVKGIIGEGMSFTVKEKNEASHHNFTNITNNIQNMNHSQLQQSNDNSQQDMKTLSKQYNSKELDELFNLIKSNLEIMNLDDSNKELLVKEMKVIKEESKVESPNSSKVTAAVSSAKRIIEGTASGISARGVLYAISEFFS